MRPSMRARHRRPRRNQRSLRVRIAAEQPLGGLGDDLLHERQVLAERGLLLLACRTGAREPPARRDGDPRDPERVRCRLIGGGEVAAIRRRQPGRPTKRADVLLQGREERGAISFVPGQDLVVADNAAVDRIDPIRTRRPNSFGLCGLPGRPLRMTCVCGSNRLSTLPSACGLPRNSRSVVWAMTCSTSGRCWRSAASCVTTVTARPTSGSCGSPR